jgi:hypothetical protein
MSIYDRDYMRAPLKRWNNIPKWRMSGKKKKNALILTAAAILIAVIVLPSYLPFVVLENRSELAGAGPSVLTITSIVMYPYPNGSATYKVYTKVDYGFGSPLISWFYYPWALASFGPTSSTLKYDARMQALDKGLMVKIIKGSPTQEAQQFAKSFGSPAFKDDMVPDKKILYFDGSWVDDSGARYKRKWEPFYRVVRHLQAVLPNFKKFFSAPS